MSIPSLYGRASDSKLSWFCWVSVTDVRLWWRDNSWTTWRLYGICFSLENSIANYKTKFGFLNRFVIPNKHQILLGDFNENFRAKLTAGGSNHNFSPRSTRCRYHSDFILCTSSKNASTTKVEYFFLNGFTILNKHRIFPAGRLNKPFVEILLNFQTRRNLLSLCINYILQS